MVNTPTDYEPGIYYGVTWADYFAIPAMNKSTLCTGLKSMAHLRAYQDQPPREPTSAMLFGTFVHAAKLEPLALLERYAVLPDLTDGIIRKDGTPYDNIKATTKYKDRVAKWIEQNTGKEVVSADEYARMLGMTTALRQHQRACQYLEQPGPTEVVIVWDDSTTGIRCKGRIDKLAEGTREAPDLKTCNDISRFEQYAARFSYDIQVAFYQDGLETVMNRPCEPWAVPLVVVEPEPPYGVAAAEMSSHSIAAGRRKYRKLLREYADCLRTNIWPGYESPPFGSCLNGL